MDPGGSDPPRRNHGKQVADETPKRRRNRRSSEVVLNIGNMRQGHTFVGPPTTEPIAPRRPSSPSGPGFYHFPSHGRHMGPPHEHMPTPAPQNDVDPHIETEQDGEDDEDDVDPEVEVVIIDGVRYKVIYPSGDALLPAKTSSSNITRVIRKMYFQKCRPKWTKVSEKEKKELLDFFREKVTWREEDDDEVQRIFNKRMSAQISDLLYKLRVKNQQPNYMSDDVWNAFKDHWATAKFKSISEKAKKNRNSDKGGSLHTGGSINQAQHALRLSKKAGRPITAPELHRATHVRKGTNEFVDERARITQEKINETMTQLTQGSWDPAALGELPPEMRDLANINWEKMVGWYKGRLYGTGPLAPILGVMGPSGAETSRAGSLRGRRNRSNATNSTAETEQLRQELHSTQQQLIDTQKEVRSWRADYAKVLHRQELMYKYFKNMLPGEMPDEESDHEEEDKEVGDNEGVDEEEEAHWQAQQQAQESAESEESEGGGSY